MRSSCVPISASSFSVSVYAIPSMFEDDDDDGECISSIKLFNGIAFNALNLIELDVCAWWLRASACFIDFVILDKSACAASDVDDDDDVIFSKKDFITGFNDSGGSDDVDVVGTNGMDAYECLFDSYIAHSSTL